MLRTCVGIIGLAFLAAACARKTVPQQSTGQQYIEQDVQKSLTDYPAPPYKTQPPSNREKAARPAPAKVAFSHEDNARVGEWLDSLRSSNQKIKFARGFRIQLYVGSDREAAFRAKETAYKLLKGAEVYLTYTLPTFRVQAGDYMDRLQAEAAFRSLRSRYPDAMIVRERVMVSK